MGETVGYGIAALWGTLWVYVGLRRRHYLVDVTLRWRRPFRARLPVPLRWVLMPPWFVSPRWVMREVIFVALLIATVTAMMWAGFIGGLYEIITTHR